LGKDQPFYGLQARGLDGRDEPDSKIEEMAERYVQAVRAFQPNGPYYIGGYCFGGVIAFEMARQIQDKGQKVALLAILEGYAPLPHLNDAKKLWRPQVLARFAINFPHWLRDNLYDPKVRQKLMGQLRGGFRRIPEPREWDNRVKHTFAENFGDAQDVPESYGRLMAAHSLAMSIYIPHTYPDHLTLFRVRTSSLLRSTELDKGWGKLAARGVTIRMVSGAHFNILEKPHVNILAEDLRKSLEMNQLTQAVYEKILS
jgi:thioesterase domain-containing protein